MLYVAIIISKITKVVPC